MLDSILKNFRAFYKGSILRKGISLFLVHYFSLKEEKDTFLSYFNKIDLDRDGQLCFQELVKAYSFKVSLNVWFDLIGKSSLGKCINRLMNDFMNSNH